MVEVVYTSLADEGKTRGTIFKGIKFWLSRKVPQRSRFIAEVLANGGEVISSEKQADILIVDHARKEALPGTYSYQFIEKSIRNGILEELEDHAVGPPVGTIRAAGSSTQPARIRRQKFTLEDDRILLTWVQDSLRKGGRTEGNEIYKQLEAENPRHPWQSWRDRWVKCLKDTCPPLSLDEGSPSLETDDSGESGTPGKVHKSVRRQGKAKKAFSTEDAKALLNRAEDIENIPPENLADAWGAWAHEYDDDRHSAQEWQDFWGKCVRPIYLKRLKRENRSRQSSADSLSEKIQSTQNQESKSPNATLFVSQETDAQPVRSPAYQPQSPEIPSSIHSRFPNPRNKDIPSNLEGEDRGSDPASQEVFYPAIEAPTEGKMSPKRKRVASEDEFPSSSPPYVDASHKRQRRPKNSMPAEIAPTPEQSPVHNHHLSPVLVQSRKAQRVIDFAYKIGTKDTNEVDDEDDTKPINPNRDGNESSEEGDNVDEDEKILGRQSSPVLSEADHKTGTIQTSFKESSPFIDFDVASPEDGWEGLPPASSPPPSSPPSLTPLTAIHRKTQIGDTFAIPESQTLMPDFSIPSPDGGWDKADVPSSPPDDTDLRAPASPTQSEIGALLDAWIGAQVAAGFSSQDVQTALECTSLDTTLAQTVLRRMKRNDGRIPSDMAGVWTALDDQRLESADARAIQDLERKHGEEHLRTRWDFLDACRNG